MISSPADTLFSVVSAPVFLFVGHGVGQNTILVFCLLWARALSCSKAGFLTEYAELGKMQSGAARTAGGWSHLREEVVDMPITITLHIFGYTVTIRIKGENRHPGVAAHKTGFEKQILWQLLDNGC